MTRHYDEDLEDIAAYLGRQDVREKTAQQTRIQEHKPVLSFVYLEPSELHSSVERSREAWDTYRQNIERQIQDYFDPQPDEEEIEGLSLWDACSSVIVLYDAPISGIPELLAAIRTVK